MSLNHTIAPRGIIVSLIIYRGLILELAQRDFVGRYKGSFMGVFWSLLNPLFMLSVYTIVFSVVFKARWGIGDESKASFAIVLFTGMIVQGLFAECLNRAPGLILAQPNYVKKVVFPLEIFPWVSLASALLNFIISFTFLAIFCVISGLGLHLTILLTPLVMAPLLLIILGLSWLFASLGVYLKDISQIMGFANTVLLFLSPVFYKASALPKEYQLLLALNPLTLPIEQLRDVMLWGNGIDWISWGVSLLISIAIFYIGFWWFQKTRKGFADVI